MRYKMPSLSPRPTTFPCPSILDSTCVRHMAHCADAEVEINCAEISITSSTSVLDDFMVGEFIVGNKGQSLDKQSLQ